jgi:hypothetical protein
MLQRKFLSLAPLQSFLNSTANLFFASRATSTFVANPILGNLQVSSRPSHGGLA